MSSGTKFDANKAALFQVPHDALELVAHALDFGGRKYDDYNWTKGFEWSRLYSASQRHRGAFFWRREDYDKESGIMHLAHAVCSDLFLIEHFLKGLGTDNRPHMPANVRAGRVDVQAITTTPQESEYEKGPF